MDYSGAGDVDRRWSCRSTSHLTPPRAPARPAARPADFAAAWSSGKIALLQRGTCPFGAKVANAEAAGAIGAIVMNQGNGDPVANVDRYNLFLGTLGAPVGIPAVSVSRTRTGEAFANTPGPDRADHGRRPSSEVRADRERDRRVATRRRRTTS